MQRKRIPKRQRQLLNPPSRLRLPRRRRKPHPRLRPDVPRLCSNPMTEYTERLLSDSPRKEGMERVRVVWLIVIPLVAILSQVYVPRFIHFLAYLELPLLITVHFALSRGGPISAVFYGMA